MNNFELITECSVNLVIVCFSGWCVMLAFHVFLYLDKKKSFKSHLLNFFTTSCAIFFFFMRVFTEILSETSETFTGQADF